MNKIEHKRFTRMLREHVDLLRLDLRGMRVLTELGSNYYMSTPLLAALAGADVVALGRDSSYGHWRDIASAVESLATELDILQPIAFTNDRRDPRISGVDLIANGGLIRPLDQDLLTHAGPQVCVSYMAEAWEIRPGDIDLDFCRANRIPIVFSDENGWDMGVLDSCGQLALKMCFEAGLEVRNNRIAVLSSDRFGPVITEALLANGAKAVLFEDSYEGVEEDSWDGLVVAEYVATESILGGRIQGDRLKALLRAAPVVVQFAGANLFPSEPAIKVFPDIVLSPVRMAKSLDYLGPLPVVRLSGIGLKVGEFLVRGRDLKLAGADMEKYVIDHAPAQRVM